MRSLALALLACLLLIGCRNSSDVMGSGIIQKRKYCNGWYVDRPSKSSSTETVAEIQVEKVAEEKIAQMESAEAAPQEEEVQVVVEEVAPETPDISASAQTGEEAIAIVFSPLKRATQYLSTRGFSSDDRDHTTLSLGEKQKKKKKPAMPPAISWGVAFACMSTWFYGWTFLELLNIPALGLVLGGIGLICSVTGLFKLKEVKKHKGRAVLACIVGILLSLFSIIICIGLLF